VRPTITDCHTCYLAGLAVPAIYASYDGDFYCDNCRKNEGLDAAQLLTIPEYLVSFGHNKPKPVAMMPTPKPTLVQNPARPKNPNSPWRGHGSLGLNTLAPAAGSNALPHAPAAGSNALPNKDEGHVAKSIKEITMPTAVAAEKIWCSKCQKIKIKATSTTGKCVPCQCGFSPTNPKRLALEARDALAPAVGSAALPHAPAAGGNALLHAATQAVKKPKPAPVPESETPLADAYLQRCRDRRSAQPEASNVATLPRKVVAIALELDEEQLDAWWGGLPFETRGVLFQHFFHGVQA
jgi:hypothetical protein